MSNQQDSNLESIFKMEYRRYQFFRIILPFGLLLVISYLFLGDFDSSFLLVSIFIPFLYPLIYIPLFEKGAKDWSLVTPPTKFFTNISFEKATLRFYYAKKLLKQTFYASIVIAIVVIVGFNIITESSDQRFSKYSDLESKYKTKLKEFTVIEDADLLNYFKTEIFLKDNFSARSILIPILEKEIESEIKDSDDLNVVDTVKDQVYDVLDKKSNYELLQMLHVKIEQIPSDDLREIILETIEDSKPNRLSFESSDGKLLVFLIVVTFLPAFMLYSIGFLFFQYSRSSEYFLCFARGCFLISQNTSVTNSNVKQRFLTLGIFAYDDYIKKTLKMKINNMDFLISKIIMNPLSKIINLSKNFEGYLEQNDKLELLRILEQEYSEKKYSFLKKDPLVDRIKHYSSFILPAITVMVTVLGLFFRN